MNDKVFWERYRVSPNILDQLEAVLSEKLKHKTGRNQSPSPRDQIKIFLHFLGKARQILLATNILTLVNFGFTTYEAVISTMVFMLWIFSHHHFFAIDHLLRVLPNPSPVFYQISMYHFRNLSILSRDARLSWGQHRHSLSSRSLSLQCSLWSARRFHPLAGEPSHTGCWIFSGTQPGSSWKSYQTNIQIVER